MHACWPAGAPAAGEGAQKIGGEEEADFKPTGAIRITYDVARGSYAGFQNQLRQVLATSRIVETIPVMVRQTMPAPPPTWILVTLIGRSAQEKVTTAVRNDNVYIAGFSSGRGTWFAFPRFQRQIQGSTALPRTDEYGSLVGGHGELPNYDISKESILDAVRFLSMYRSAPADDKSYDDNLGISLARLIVVVAEAARFKSVYNTVAQGLQLQQQTQMSKKEAKLLVLWAPLSKDLIDLQKTGKWVQGSDYRAAGVTSQQDAIDALRLLIWPKGEELAKLPATSGNTTF